MALKNNKNRKSLMKKWIDGDMLLDLFMSRYIGLIVLIVALVIVYVSNRYAFQLEQLEIQKLRTELVDVKYEALARSSELMEKSRESNIQRFVAEQGGELKISTKAPVILKK